MPIVFAFLRPFVFAFLRSSSLHLYAQTIRSTPVIHVCLHRHPHSWFQWEPVTAIWLFTPIILLHVCAPTSPDPFETLHPAPHMSIPCATRPYKWECWIST
ncbi:hypothetical protein BT96DRAFT_986836 [Gymnopus androsaceus JB14]|uniref:Uncharacterized protein n=1 Tax=Gymnopus androsaceus JB14 TaxID=1447944 RepID=A0A6A4I966_9AGAR|nr:hypothetical protein BT96DRAFT_986836 [Gymnopus androsaceus JB14]